MSSNPPDEHVPDIYELSAQVEKLTFALRRAADDLTQLDPEGENYSSRIIVEDALRTVEDRNYESYLKQAPLPEALWWFIENADRNNPRFNEYFFLLRERVRNQD